MNRISPTIAALRRKLGEARHGGKFFSSEEIDGLLVELRGIQDGAEALERQSAPAGRGSTFANGGVFRLQKGSEAAAATGKSMPVLSLPIGTIFFQPAGAH